MNMVCMGDSLTKGGAYVAKAICNRISEKYPSLYVINLGVGGEETGQMLARASEGNRYNPFRVLVWGGINDIAHSLSVATIESNLQALYNFYASATCEVWAMTITQNEDNTGTMNTNRNTVNTWIKNTATNVSKIIDAYTIIGDPLNMNNRLPAYVDPSSPNHINDLGMAAIVTYL